MLRIAVVLAVVCAACGGTQRPKGRGQNAEYLAEIRIEGNHGIETADLVDGLILHRTQQAGRAPDPFELAQDVERIRGAYQRLGYFTVDVKARIAHKGPASTAVFTIIEGRRATVHLEIRGMIPGPLYERLRAEMALKEGVPFDYDVYDDAKSGGEKFLQNEGYAYASVEGEVFADNEHALANVFLTIQAGPPCTFGNYTISGAYGDLADAVQARVAFKPGDRYSVDAIEKTHKAISEFGRFSTVKIKPGLDSNATVVTVSIGLSEGQRHELRLGGGVGLDPVSWEGRLRGGYSINGPRTDAVSFPLTTVSLDLQPAYALLRQSNGYTPDFSQGDPRIRATLDIRRADLFRTYMNGDLEVGATYNTVEAFTDYGIRVRPALSTPLGAKWLTAKVAWQLEYLGYRDYNPAIADAMTQQGLGVDKARLDGAYQESIAIDLRDQPVQSHQGVYVALQVNEGGSFAGGELTYTKLTPDLRAFLPLGSAVLASRFRLGAFIGDVPATQRFFDGGSTSQRGFPTRTLSPSAMALDDSGNVISVVVGGGASIETGIEVRLPIGTIKGFDLELVPFLDGADVTETPSQLNISHLHWATGGGLHWVSKYGSVGVDVGYRLNRKGPTEPNPGESWSWNLSIGEAY